MMTNLGCELAWIWNQLKHKLIGTAMRDFLDFFFFKQKEPL